MAGRNKIDWDNIKVTFVEADKENPNPLNPYSHMTQEQREKEIIELAAKIWVRHCMEKMEEAIKKSGSFCAVEFI